MVRNRRRGSDHNELAQGAACASDALRPIAAVDDQLGDERVVVRRHIGAGTEPGVDTYARPRRRNPSRDPPRVGYELAKRIFCIDPHLDRMSFPFDVLLGEAQLETGRDSNLLFHQVDAGHRLCDRMLDLQPGVHLEEVELAVAEDELHGARIDVSGSGRGPDRGAAHGRADFRRNSRGRSLFHDLLVATLDGALAFAQVDRVPVAVADDLDLDVPRPADVPFEVHGRVPEG